MRTVQVHVTQVEYGDRPLQDVMRDIVELLTRTHYTSPASVKQQPTSSSQAMSPVGK